MLIKLVKRSNGDGVIIFHGDEGRSFRLLMNPQELNHFAGLVRRLAEAPPDRAFDILHHKEETDIGLYGFREVK
jgi:hypothetical protein